MKRFALILGLLGVLVAPAAAGAKGKPVMLWGKFNQALGKTLTFDVKVEFFDLEHKLTFSTATDYYQISRPVKGVDLRLTGWIRAQDNGWLVQSEVGLYGRRSSSKKKVDHRAEFHGKLSVFIKEGGKAVIFNDDKVKITLHLRKVK